MASKLRIRMYNVLLGDAILVSVPDSENGTARTRHILIDYGNKYNNEGSDDSVFEPVIKDVLKQLNGQPLDLYVMTHEHLDHNQGLLHVSAKAGIDVKEKLKVRHVWLTASADPDYKDKFPDAVKEMALADAAYDEAERYLTSAPDEETPFARTLLAINNPRRTADCVDFARALNPAKTHYIFRGINLAGKHPFEVAKFSIWAPEEDSTTYYGKNKIAPLFAGAGGGTATVKDLPLPLPPPGVDAGAFYDLVHARMSGVIENLLAIDKAGNDTSIVFCLEWKGLKLLFTGDAEERSWKEMDERSLLKPVHFLKISHHGSHNGTPGVELLEKVLPLASPDGKVRYAAVSTCLNAYNGIPHTETINDVKKRVKRVYSTLTDSQVGKWVDVTFSA